MGIVTKCIPTPLKWPLWTLCAFWAHIGEMTLLTKTHSISAVGRCPVLISRHTCNTIKNGLTHFLVKKKDEADPREFVVDMPGNYLTWQNSLEYPFRHSVFDDASFSSLIILYQKARCRTPSQYIIDNEGLKNL